MAYSVPEKTIRVEQDIRRSRFIATVGRAENRAAALAFIDAVRSEFPDATHNCWAYVAGPPGNTLDIGMSDDGELHGVAGRPMLQTLQHKHIGEIAVVVTRYFGGIKLGAGGLVRAYSSSVQQALDALPLTECVVFHTVHVAVPYALENVVRHLLGTLEITGVEALYGERVTLVFNTPETIRETLTARIHHETAGAATIQWS